MNNTEFLTAYNASRNGANQFYRHSLVSKFHYSDGVRDCAQAGLYWLLDILATEGVEAIRKAGETLATVALVVHDDKATLKLSGYGDEVFWTREVEYTDAPEGTWTFLLADEGARLALILVSEY